MNKKWRRRESLLEKIRGKGEVTVEALAEFFSTSASTIRRDLDTLEREEIIIRTHGGVMLSQGFTVLVKLFEDRKNIMAEEKKRIAKEVCKNIREHSSVILDNGTTAYYVARLLTKRSGMTIATNSLAIAGLFGSAEKDEVIISGGDYRARNNDCIGKKTVDFYKDMYFDYAVLTPDMIVPGNGFFKMSCHSADIASAMKEAAKEVMVACDHTKFLGSGNFRCAAREDISAIFLDDGLSEENLSAIHTEPYKIILC